MYEKLKNEILAKLTEKRLVHTEGVRRTAAGLCEIYGEDKEKVDLAVCFHDLYRGKQAEELDRLIEKYGVPERYKGNANLAHGKLAAAAMEQDYGLTDEDVLNAVSFHTTGRAAMSTMEKIVFLADAIEPGRDYPGVDALRKMAEESLDKACLMSLEGTIKFLEEQGVADIDTDTIEARDYLLETINSEH
ncbi:MAG: bis(5'-nucleosyl)-tetraphosphatase (symmetrical) YqeK [Firmicutes bacterium]|nr:bis(5'-nucleosyl)-tetraphosphatase (symmetrical) YqeK [Bacillota bacterium]